MEQNEAYPSNWKHCTIHLNPETGEMHSDGDHSVREWIQDKIKYQRYLTITILKDIESFCDGRQKLKRPVNTSEDAMVAAYRDVKFLVRQHLSSCSKDNNDLQKIIQIFLNWLRSYRDTVIEDKELRHILNEACDRLDVLDSKLYKRGVSICP